LSCACSYPKTGSHFSGSCAISASLTLFSPRPNKPLGLKHFATGSDASSARRGWF
jgi:hypothetical protein